MVQAPSSSEQVIKTAFYCGIKQAYHSLRIIKNKNMDREKIKSQLKVGKIIKTILIITILYFAFLGFGAFKTQMTEAITHYFYGDLIK